MKIFSIKAARNIYLLFTLLNIALAFYIKVYIENPFSSLILVGSIELIISLFYVMVVGYNRILNSIKETQAKIDSRFIAMNEQFNHSINNLGLEFRAFLLSERKNKEEYFSAKHSDLIFKIQEQHEGIAGRISKSNMLLDDMLRELLLFKEHEASFAVSLNKELDNISEKLALFKQEESDLSGKTLLVIGDVLKELLLLKEQELKDANATSSALKILSKELLLFKAQESDIANKTTINLDFISKELGIIKQQESDIVNKTTINLDFISKELGIIKQQESDIANKMVARIEFILKELLFLKTMEEELSVRMNGEFSNVNNKFLIGIETIKHEFANKIEGVAENILKELILLKNQENALGLRINNEFTNTNSKFSAGIEAAKSDLQKEFEALKKEQLQIAEKSNSSLTGITNNLEKYISSNISIEHQLKEDEQKLKEVIENISNSRKDLDKSIMDRTNWLNNNMKWEVSATYDRIDALLSIHQLLDLNSSLPAMNDWAISSDYGHVLVKSILSKKSGDVIDVGSGITTILSGYALKKRGKGKVIALEHDPVFFKKLKILIAEHKIGEYVNAYYCPLKEYVIKGEKWMWYDLSQIKLPKEVSVISVDGPPGNIQQLARFPAVPLLRKNITKNTLVLLDDGAREDEKKIAERWKSEYQFNIEFYKSHKGYYACHLK